MNDSPSSLPPNSSSDSRGGSNGHDGRSGAGRPEPLLREIGVRRILLPVDASEAALQPLGLAAELARALRADLHFLWVDAADQESPPPEFPSRQEVDEALWLAEPERLREVAQSSGYQPALIRALAYGATASSVIAEYCVEQAIDLVIMASRRRGVVARLLDKSSAVDVVRHAPCSVLVVPDGSLEKVIAIPPQMLVAVDDSEESSSAMGVAEALRRSLEGDLFLVHVESAPRVGEAASLAAVSSGDDGMRALLEDAMESGRVEAELLIRRGAPAATILQVVDELDTDLLVMGSHGRQGLQRLLLGSVAEHVIVRSPVPVLVVRSVRTA